MSLPDGVYRKETPSVEKLNHLKETNPNDIRLHPSSINSLIGILIRTGRVDEAKKIKETFNL